MENASLYNQWFGLDQVEGIVTVIIVAFDNLFAFNVRGMDKNKDNFDV